jgi:hypothetical protein
MSARTGLHVYQKALLFWGTFLALYLAYKFVPAFPLSLIAGVGESNFQHYKAGFYGYLIASLIEFVLVRQHLANAERFAFSRILTSIFLPWMIFVLWYIAPAVYGRMPNIALEIIYANIITLVVGVFAAIFDRGFEQMAYSRALKTIILVLFLTSIGLYVIFTFKLPWADVFVEPQWK